MAGIRPSKPNLDDVDTKINKDNYKDSDYIAPEAKESIKNTTNKETDKMSTSTSTSSTIECDTSPVTGALSDVTPDENDKIIEKSLQKSDVEKMQYISQNNPEYLDEMGLSPDEIFGINMSGDSGYTYQDNEIVMDENGLVYVEQTTQTQTESQLSNITSGNVETGNQIIGTGQPTIIKVSSVFAHPTNNVGKLSSSFGLRILPAERYWQLHSGIDISAPKNTPIYAISDGVVVSINTNRDGGGYGNFIKLAFAYSGKPYFVFYAHLEYVEVIKNQKVVKGQKMGGVGGTGKKPEYGPHLHFEVRDASNRKITYIRGSINDTFVGDEKPRERKSKNISDRSLKWIPNSNTDFEIQNEFKSYINPSDFLSNPSKYT